MKLLTEWAWIAAFIIPFTGFLLLVAGLSALLYSVTIGRIDRGE